MSEISDLKETGIKEAAEAAIEAAKNGKTVPQHTFPGPVEHAIAHIEEAALHNLPEEQQRWYAIKVFERDEKVLAQLNIPQEKLAHIESDIKAAEAEQDDDAESIITNERYIYIAEVIKSCYKKKNIDSLSTSDKIDKVVTNRWLGLPIFALIMFLVYWTAMIGAIKREMNSPKWTWFAIGYQCGFAYLVALMINQFGGAFTGNLNVVGLIFALAALCFMIYMLFFKKYKEANKLA